MNEEVVAEINRLRKERNAVILAHNYTRGEVQDIADFTGDSLELARKAATIESDVIVFCGVYFMAETAAILNPEKTILPVSDTLVCPNMKKTTLENLRDCLQEMKNVVVVPEPTATQARRAVQAMLAIG